jgi:ABC-2 type transport system ATP-binding protein
LALSRIGVRDLVKDFRSPKRHPGLLGSLRTVGYLPAKRAGKSTTIKMLTESLVPTAGEVELSGLVPRRDREHNALNIGVVFGQRTQR